MTNDEIDIYLTEEKNINTTESSEITMIWFDLCNKSNFCFDFHIYMHKKNLQH